MNQNIPIIQPEPSRTVRTGRLSEAIRGSGFLLEDDMNKLELIGQRFGRLVVIRLNGKGKNGRALWGCMCDCGTEKTIVKGALISGSTKSCGCLKKEMHTTHGQHRSPEYKSWTGMIQRCTNPKTPYFKNYGGRGISVCEQWIKSFKVFLADMGKRTTPKHTLERTDTNGDYEPGNCKWATRTEQQHNTRLQANNTSGVKGVSWTEVLNKYTARIGVDGKEKHIGVFTTLLAAKKARKAAEIKYWKKGGNHA